MKVTRKGYFTVTKDGIPLLRSDGRLLRVTSRDECYEHILNSGDGIYRIHPPEWEIEVLLAGRIDPNEPPNFSPEWLTQPTPQFSALTAGTYDFDQNTTDAEGDSLTYSLSVGSNIITNGDFTTDSDWTKGTGWTISGGTATHATGSASALYQILPEDPFEVTYEVKFDVSGRTAGTVTPLVGTQFPFTSVSSNGSFTQIIVGGGEDFNLWFNASADFDGSIDNVSVKELFSTPLPSGFSLASNGTLTADGTQTSGDTSGIIIDVSDGINSPVSSSAFTITVEVSEAATIVVQDDGNDTTGDGSSSTPYATMEKGLSVASPGDVVELRKSGGGTWTIDDYIDITGVNGTANNEIVLRVRIGDRVNVYPTSTQSRKIFKFTGCSYLKLDGSQGEFYWGDRSLWTSPGGDALDNYPYQGAWDFYNCQFIWMKEIEYSGGFAYNANSVLSDSSAQCSYFFFDNCNARNHGSHPDQGDGTTISGHHILIKGGSYVPCGGHSGLYLNARDLVLRNVTLNNDWANIDGSDRALDLSMHDYQPPWRYNVPPWGPALVEGCFLQNVGTGDRVTSSGEADSSYKLAQWGLIYRYNFETDILSSSRWFVEGITGTIGPTSPYYDRLNGFQRFYHNTLYNVPNVQMTNTAFVGTAHENFYEIQCMNNVHGEMNGSGYYNWKSEFVIWWREAQRVPPGPYADWWRGAKWDSNIWDFTGISQDDGGAINFRIHYEVNGEAAETITSSLSAAETEWPNVFLRNTIETPSFVDLTSRFNVSQATMATAKAGLQLADGSPGKGDSRHMASVTANSSGTTVSLDDVFWIYDGFGLEYYGETGDYLAFYSSDGGTLRGIRKCVTNNRKSTIADGQTPQITVDSNISLTSGDIVYPVKKDGATVIRDRGAPAIL